MAFRKWRAHYKVCKTTTNTCDKNRQTKTGEAKHVWRRNGRRAAAASCLHSGLELCGLEHGFRVGVPAHSLQQSGTNGVGKNGSAGEGVRSVFGGVSLGEKGVRVRVCVWSSRAAPRTPG